MAFILIVDDYQRVRTALTRLVRSMGHEAAAVDGGAMAIELLRHRPVDLLILDMLMPGMSGSEVLRVLRSDGTLARVRVIIFSTDAGAREVANDFGASFVEKPNVDALAEELGRLLQRSRGAGSGDDERPRRGRGTD